MCDCWSCGDERVGDGHQDLVELGAHRVLELEPPRALLELDLLVVGQVDGDGLRAGVGVAGVVEDVVGVQVGVRARASRACTRRAPAGRFCSSGSRLA